MAFTTPAASNEVERDVLNVTLIGTGTIGLSFAALHLSRKCKPTVKLTIYDPRPDLEDYIHKTLPEYLSSVWLGAQADKSQADKGDEVPDIEALRAAGRLSVAPSIETAVKKADIVQEQGPESIPFKQNIWREVEALAPSHALFWSSTSGIPASVQMAQMQDKARLIVLHPFNPPHVMPLLEIVPSPAAAASSVTTVIDQTMKYWATLGRKPIVLKEETTGFIANRLSFALFREAAYLAQRGVASPEDIDRIVEQSLGPRWAVRGPFWSYHAGGGQDQGLGGFFDKIGGTIQACWDDAGLLNMPDTKTGDANSKTWTNELSQQVQETYGRLGPEDLRERDEALKKILDITQG